MTPRPVERNIRLLSLFNFLTDFVPFAPVAIIYFAKVSGSFTFGMGVFAIAYLSSAVCEIPTGVLSDRIGRKKTMILGALCSFLCVVMYAVGGSFAMLSLGAIFQGMGRSFYSGNNDALLYDTLHEVKRGDDYHTYLGRTYSMFQIALALSGVLGAVIAAVSLPLVMWVSVLPQLASVLVAYAVIEPDVHWKKSANTYEHLYEAFRLFGVNTRLRLLTYGSAVRFALEESSYFLRSAMYQTLWPLWALGLSSIITHVSAAVSFYHAGKVIDRLGALRTLQYGIIAKTIASLAALLWPTIATPVIMSGTSITYGVGIVSANTLMQRDLSSAQRATMASLNSLAASVTFGIVALVLGSLADRWGTFTALILLHVCFILPVLIYGAVYKQNTTDRK